jgi:hypothetical protein
MWADAERDVRVRSPGEIELVRIDEHPLVPVGRGDRWLDELTRADAHSVDLDVCHGHPDMPLAADGYVRGKWREAQQFLHCLRYLGHVRPQPGELVGVREQEIEATGELVHHAVVHQQGYRQINYLALDDLLLVNV